MTSCANCDNSFEKKPGNRGYYRYSLENALPHSGEVAREALSSISGAWLTPVAKKRRGQYLCPACWSHLDDTVRYQDAVKEFWSRTEDKTYIGFKRKPEDGQDTVPKKPRYTSTPLKTKGQTRKSLFLRRKAELPSKWDTIVTAVRARHYGRAVRGLFEATPGSKRQFLNFLSRQIRKEVLNVLSSNDFPLAKEVNIPNIEKFSWDTVLSQLEQLAPLLSTVLKSTVTRKANQETLIRGKQVNLKPQLGTAIAYSLHAKAPRRASFIPTLFSIQFWRGGLKRETIKQFSHTGICVGYDKTLNCVDKISKDFDEAAKTCKHLIEEQMNDVQETEVQNNENLELSVAMAATVPNIEDEETILFSDDDDDSNALRYSQQTDILDTDDDECDDNIDISKDDSDSDDNNKDDDDDDDENYPDQGDNSGPEAASISVVIEASTSVLSEEETVLYSDDNAEVT